MRGAAPCSWEKNHMEEGKQQYSMRVEEDGFTIVEDLMNESLGLGISVLFILIMI